MERKLVLQHCLYNQDWSLLELYGLLTDDIIALDVSGGRDTGCHQMQTFDDDAKFRYHKYPNLLLTLVRARCPVSVCPDR